MNTLIIYNSATGYTQRYAELLQGKIGDANTVPLKKFKTKMLNDCDRVVFMARVVNNTIDGFKTVVKNAEKFAQKYACVVAVGMSPPTAQLYHAVESANIPYKLKGIPLFNVQGGFDAEKLTGKNKLMIKFMRMQLLSAKSRTREDMAMLGFLDAKTDKCSEEQLDGVLKFIESGIFNPPPAPEDDDVSGEFWMPLDEFMPKSILDEQYEKEERAKQAQAGESGDGQQPSDDENRNAENGRQGDAFQIGKMKE